MVRVEVLFVVVAFFLRVNFLFLLFLLLAVSSLRRLLPPFAGFSLICSVTKDFSLQTASVLMTNKLDKQQQFQNPFSRTRPGH
jgi:hypothetical protein